MNLDRFICLECSRSMLRQSANGLVCPICSASYPLEDGIPILLPSSERQRAVTEPEFRDVSLRKLQGLYDRAYQSDGLMGTDLDETYDMVTKQTLLSFVEPSDGKRLLDLGTGTGKLWDYANPAIEGYAVDLSAIGLSRAVQRRRNLVASVSIAEFLPYPDGYFDAVIAADTIEHTFSPQRVLEEIHRVLSSGGVLSASFPIPNSLRKWGWNRLVKGQLGLRFFGRLAWTLAKRTWLFGRPDFQPIDRDYDQERWVTNLKVAGFQVIELIEWPEPPSIAIVYLVHAVRG